MKKVLFSNIKQGQQFFSADRWKHRHIKIQQLWTEDGHINAVNLKNGKLKLFTAGDWVFTVQE